MTSQKGSAARSTAVACALLRVSAAMTAKAPGGSPESNTDGAPPSGNGLGTRAPTRRELERLERRLEELEARVTQDRRDLDVQFQRLAELQSVIDRIQIAASNARARRTPRNG
jgi:TolA-binding protein